MTAFHKHQHLMLIIFMGLLAVTFFPVQGPDMPNWVRWGGIIFQQGWVEGYKLVNSLHPPLLYFFLGFGVKLASGLGLAPYLGIKITLLFFFVATMLCLYNMSRDLALTFCFYLILLLNAVALSYVDIYFAPFILLFVYGLQKKHLSFALACFTVAAMVKYASIIVAPFVLVFLIAASRRTLWKSFAQYALVVLVILLPLILVFKDSFLNSLLYALNQRSVPTSNALNVHALLGRIIGIDYGSNEQWMRTLSFWSKCAFGFFYISCLTAFALRRKSVEYLLLSAIVGHIAYFVICIGVHENHLFLSSLLAMALACLNRQYVLFAITVGAISTFNMFSFYFYNGTPEEMLLPQLLMSIFNVMYFLTLWVVVMFWPPAISTRGAIPFPDR